MTLGVVVVAVPVISGVVVVAVIFLTERNAGYVIDYFARTR